jgi:hypothetical protein
MVSKLTESVYEVAVSPLSGRANAEDRVACQNILGSKEPGRNHYRHTANKPSS